MRTGTGTDASAMPAMHTLQQSTLPDAPLPPGSLATGGVTWRAFLLGLPLLIGISILSVYADMVSQVVQLGVMQIAPPAVAALLLLAVANRGLSRLLRREWLSKGDLIAIYSMLLVGVLISTRGVTEKLIPPLAYLPYFATRENNLNQILTQHLPAWAVPFVPSAQVGPPPDVIKGFWEGHARVPWSAWAGPMCAWFGLILCVMWVFLCLATILRRQWMDNEQIRFPLARLPLAILHNEVEGQSFFSNRGMWIGFAISCFVFGLNGLHANFPDWPSIQLTLDIGPLLTEKPWNAMQNPPIFLSLAAIGFAYFLPLDLLFSMWFFYLLTRAQDVFIALLGGQPTGMGTHGTNIFQGYQAAGAYLVLVVAQLRIGWPYFKQVFIAAFGKSTLDDRDELMSYRIAVWGLLIGFAGIVVWLWLAGMNPIFAAAQMGLFIFFIALMMSRAVCEAGFLGTETSFLPSHLINLVYPLPSLGAQNLTMMGLTDTVFTRDLRGVLLSAFLDSQKIAKESGLRPRALLAPMVLAVVVSFAASTAFFLYLHYTQGGLSLYSYPRYNAANLYGRAASAIGGAGPPADATAYGGVLLGGVVTCLLVWLRARFLWFPFHPLGYALSAAGTMNVYWFPFFAAWIVKSLILRFGGIDTYRRIAPFMLGLIGGEFMMGMFWAAMNMWRGWSAPQFPWP